MRHIHAHVALATTLTVGLAISSVQAADEIRAWSDTATSALLEELYRAAAPDERIVHPVRRLDKHE